MSFALKVREVNKKVRTGNDELHILKDINFELEASLSLSIIGPSGAGKSTLLSILAGLDEPTSGRVFVDDKEVFSMPDEERTMFRGQNIGIVFQNFYLLDNLTAMENVAIARELQEKEPIAESLDIAQKLLDDVGLSHRLNHYPRQLSGGEHQRVAIARAFANHPKLLLCDEPTGSLDQATGDKIIDMLFRMNETQKTTLIMITHDSELASKCVKSIRISEGTCY